MTLTVETTHGDLDLSFGSVIRRRNAPVDRLLMIVGVRQEALIVDVVPLYGTTNTDMREIPWYRLDHFEQAPHR